MEDRLMELTGRTNARSPFDEEAAWGSSSSKTASADGQGFMGEYFEAIEEVKSGMTTIKHNLRSMVQLHGECLTAISTEQSAAATDQVQRLMGETGNLAQSIQRNLKDLDAQNKAYAAANPGAADARIRSNMHGAVTRKFVELMTEYQDMQAKYKGKYKERVERQYRIVKPTATTEEIEAVFEGDSQPEIFTQQILQGPGHAMARNALADIQDKHRDILALEASIAELHQLFVDMSVLVSTQGELLNHIEYEVGQAVNYTGKAIKELKAATSYQKKIRKKMCCLILVFAVILCFVLAPILGPFINEQIMGNASPPAPPARPPPSPPSPPPFPPAPPSPSPPPSA